MVSEPGIISVYTDENRLKQVLYNFLTNASKFTLKGEITFGYKVKDKDVEFFVTDTGIGIKEEYLSAIFNRFYKVNNVEYTTLPRGSGIGLSISKILIEKMGGTVSVNSVYGKGSAFSFILPSVILETVPEPEVKSFSGIAFNPAGSVLVTEDDNSNMLLITIMLRKYGVAFEVASNGVEALEVFRNHPDIELVLMDINMPLMNGYEAMRELKVIKPGIPVVALTAHAMLADKEKALAAGFDGYITKPVDQLVLAGCLKKYLEKYPVEIS